MRVYIINKMQDFRAYVDAEGIHIEKDGNLQLGINTRYIALLIRFSSEYSDMRALYNELCYRLEGDWASVWLDATIRTTTGLL